MPSQQTLSREAGGWAAKRTDREGGSGPTHLCPPPSQYVMLTNSASANKGN